MGSQTLESENQYFFEQAIDKKEFGFLIQKEFNLPASKDDIDQIFAIFDTNGSGSISYFEFNKKMGILVHGKGGTQGMTFDGDLVEDKIRPTGIISALSPDVKWNNRWRQVGGGVST